MSSKKNNFAKKQAKSPSEPCKRSGHMIASGGSSALLSSSLSSSTSTSSSASSSSSSSPSSSSSSSVLTTYLVGGCSESALLSDVWMFDQSTELWTDLSISACAPSSSASKSRVSNGVLTYTYMIMDVG